MLREDQREETKILYLLVYSHKWLQQPRLVPAESCSIPISYEAGRDLRTGANTTASWELAGSWVRS